MRVETAAVKWKKDNVVGFLVVHLISALAFFPWFFSWTGVALFVTGIVAFGMLGINLCYHRLLAHRSFSCPPWLEHGLAILATCSMQDSPSLDCRSSLASSVADEEQDPTAR